MLNWRRDPGYEQRISANLMAIERSKERTKQIENEILRVRNDSEQIESEILRLRNDSKRIEKETEQIRKETEQMKQENARLRILNAKTRHLISCVDQLCFPPDSNSIHQTPIEPGSKPFLPS
jgi:septal ring factor EnvC (AmiA/AmiB activator)